MEQPSFDWMIQALRASGTLCDVDAEMPGLYLAMNDVFGYATADAEEIALDDIPIVYALWKVFGWQGVTWWVWQRRKQEPIREVRLGIEERLQRTVED